MSPLHSTKKDMYHFNDHSTEVRINLKAKWIELKARKEFDAIESREGIAWQCPSCRH